MMSACGVLCSECAAFIARTKSSRYRQTVAAAWHRIYGLSVNADDLTCGGCGGADEELFHTSRNCRARRCCHTNGFATCAECPTECCSDLERAQSNWDEVPDLARSLSAKDFATYARPYCGHRDRLAAARADRRRI